MSAGGPGLPVTRRVHDPGGGGAGLDALRHHPAGRLHPAAADAGQHGGDAGRDRLDHHLQHPGDRHRHPDDRLPGRPLRPPAGDAVLPSPASPSPPSCAARPSRLETLVLWRIVQGGIGAPVVPLANAIVLDSFPRRQAGLVSSIFGMTVVLGPVIGPALRRHAGRDLQLALGLLHDRPGRRARRRRAAPDPAAGPARQRASGWTGSASWRCPPPSPACSSCCRAASGWTGSNRREIIAETGVAALAFYVFLAHSLTAERPFLNLRLLLDRNYALGLVLVLHLRHGELHADRAAAVAAADLCRLSRLASSA